MNPNPSLSSMRSLLAIAAVVVSACANAATARSDFTAGADGWLLSGDSTTAVPAFIASGGNPGGYIHGTDQTVGGLWQWQAPDKFLGDRSLSFGQMLSFELRMRGSGPLFDLPDVTLSGGLTPTVLHVDLSPVPQNVAWTSYAVPLSEAGGWKLVSGAAATAPQIQDVLANLTTLRIRGEFISGPDSGDLDNVVMAAIPEPQAYMLFGVGLGAVAWIARRRTRREARAW